MHLQKFCKAKLGNGLKFLIEILIHQIVFRILESSLSLGNGISSLSALNKEEDKRSEINDQEVRKTRKETDISISRTTIPL